MSKPFTKHYLRSLVSEIEKRKNWIANKLDFDWDCFSKNTYLIRFGHIDAYNKGYQPILLMGDFGVTWEPARAYPTEAFGYINGDDPSKDAKAMIKMASEYYNKLDIETIIGTEGK